MADLDQRMKMLAVGIQEGDNTDESFKDRAEFYFEKRPQLLALLQDLYNGYVALSDRYIQSLMRQSRHHRRQSSQLSFMDNESFTNQDEDGGITMLDSDAESSLSYQLPPMLNLTNNKMINGDAVVAELVIKNVEFDIMLDEVAAMERKCNESSRKIELQKSLLEVLESERLMLLNENAKLRCQVKALVDENKDLASESMFVKKKASEMARVLLKMREEQRVCMLSRKIEDLEEKIEGLEKKNKECHEQAVNKDYYQKIVNSEYYEQVAMKEHQVKQNLKKKKKMMMLSWVDLKVKKDESLKDDDSKKKGYKWWWGKVKGMDLFLCGCRSS